MRLGGGRGDEEWCFGSSWGYRHRRSRLDGASSPSDNRERSDLDCGRDGSLDAFGAALDSFFAKAVAMELPYSVSQVMSHQTYLLPLG